MDFVEIKERITKQGTIEIYPNFKVQKSKDLMVRGKSFYAVWDQEANMWSTDEFDVQRLVDKELMDYKNTKINPVIPCSVKLLSDFSSNKWSEFQRYLTNQPDYYRSLDTSLTFSNTEVSREDFVSKRLPYPLEEGSIDAYEEIISTLYSPEERDKLEWAIGAIIDGDARYIQKFIVLYGEAGTGKSTILNIIQKLFEGYYVAFDAKAITTSSNQFATEAFKNNPLVAIQHDGDLSRIEDNTKLNSIVSHEMMTVNEKYKPSYMTRTECFLFMGTNKPVKITDAKSGIIRRLIDVTPTGNKIVPNRYQILMSQINFELGAIAYHCLERYHEMGKNYYSNYKPLEMMFQTDVFFNYVEEYYYIFKQQDGVSLKQAYEMYKTYCSEASVEYVMPKYKFREELKNYFNDYIDSTRVDDKQVRNYYSGFKIEKFEKSEKIKDRDIPYSLVLDKDSSVFDKACGHCPAQYASKNGTPAKRWNQVDTTLDDIDTTSLHYVKVPENHIVVDFDIKDENGNKSYEKNVAAASKWPPTYAELSKSGAGVHLHYIYTGDPTKLSRVYDDDIEIKVFTGNSSLRRKLTKCNGLKIAKLNSGLPLKGEDMVNFDTIKNEKSIRTLIKRNLNKEYHNATKPSVDFIEKILEDAYSSGIPYDVTDLRPQVLVFANNSTNHSKECIGKVNNMKFMSETESTEVSYSADKESIAFFDCEVFPNYFLIVWKYEGEDKPYVVMENPTPAEVEDLINNKLVGYNCKRYDNHILYGRLLGKDNYELFQLSQNIINGSHNALFREAYNLSYTDIYDYSSNRKSLKKWEIELGIHHQELGIPWDQPLPDEFKPLVIKYCKYDVAATEAVWNATKADFTAREILADLAGMSVNTGNETLIAKIIFGDDPHPQDKFIYTDLSEMFKGYKFENGVSTYKGEIVGEGGVVRQTEGMYGNVFVLDVTSEHPSSLIALVYFGEEYTKRYEEIYKARQLIKAHKLEEAGKLFNGALAPYVKDEALADKLQYALKIIINSVYGKTCATYNSKFKDPRNVDNIVAKRGALFMIDLAEAVRAQGYRVIHIKTDSIKIPDCDDYIVKFVQDFGAKYGYSFDIDDIYDKMCLVNGSTYIAKDQRSGKWTATGAQFKEPYVFKTLFSKEPIIFKDLCQVKESKKGDIYLDMNENSEEEHNYVFVGKVGEFCPMKPGTGGGVMYALRDGKYVATPGSKGYRWMESEMVKQLGKEDDIDRSYFATMVDKAVAAISKYGDFELFTSPESYVKGDFDILEKPAPNPYDYKDREKDIETLKQLEKEN